MRKRIKNWKIYTKRNIYDEIDNKNKYARTLSEANHNEVCARSATAKRSTCIIVGMG